MPSELKRKRPVDAPQAQSEPRRLGPDSRAGVLRCLETFLDELPSEMQASLLEKLCDGVMLTSDYSGMGQAEHALRRVQSWARERSFRRVPVVQGRACDLSSSCREVQARPTTERLDLKTNSSNLESKTAVVRKHVKLKRWL